MTPETLDKKLDELLPLLEGSPHRRPYQPYCVTVASSRPPSPDLHTSSPTRKLSARSKALSAEGQTRNVSSVGRSRSYEQTAVISPGHDGHLAILLKTGSNCKRKRIPSNGLNTLSDTTPAKSNHISQAVTPRGSHSLVSSNEPTYNVTLSHIPINETNLGAKQKLITVQRHPGGAQGKYVSMGHHPLPPLPIEQSIENSSSKNHEIRRGIRQERLDKLPTDTQAIIPCRQDEKLIELSPSAQHDIGNNQGSTSSSTLSSPGPLKVNSTLGQTNKSEASLLGPVASSYTASFTSFLLRSHHHGSQDHLVQLPKYASHESLLQVSNDMRATRRTPPKDAKLRYQFGDRPILSLELQSLPSVTLMHRPYRRCEQQSLRDVRTFAPSSVSHLSHDIQLGPRPPPWKSFETLELQRLQRGATREQAQALSHRNGLDSNGSLYKGSQSADSFRKDIMKREVEEYREQVLHLYPDLDLDGSASKDARNCCYCLMM